MDKHEYYEKVFPQLEKAFSRSGFVLASGPELLKRGWQPNSLLVTAEPIEHLRKLSVEDGMEVFIPIFAKDGSVLAPIDYEIYLRDTLKTLYASPRKQWYYHQKHIKPVSDGFEELLTREKIPYLMDLTPSGGHILFYAVPDTPAYEAFASIGYLENDLTQAYNVQDPSDLKRAQPIGEKKGLVFSGIGRWWYYASLVVRSSLAISGYPVTTCDTANRCLNIDNSWQSDPGFMRVMRSPFSLHRKNIFKAGAPAGSSPLVDVVKTFSSNGESARFDNLKELINTMWSMEKAVKHASGFTGEIPAVYDEVLPSIARYKESRLFEIIQEFDMTPDLPAGEATKRAMKDKRISPLSIDAVNRANPLLLQPHALKLFIRNLTECGWHPRHIASLIHDCYSNPKHGWKINWAKHSPRTRANYWARTYYTENLFEDGEKILSR